MAEVSPLTTMQSSIAPTATRLPALLFGSLDSAKFQPRPPHGFFASHAAAHQILRVRLHMKAQLRIHLAFHARAPQRCPQRRTKLGPERHISSLVSQCHHRIHAHRPPRRDVAGHQRDEKKKQ